MICNIRVKKKKIALNDRKERKTLNIKVNKLEHSSFKPYGALISPDDVAPCISNKEFDFWLGLDNIITGNDTAQINWLNIKYNPDFICNYLEQHINCTTTLIPVEGQAIILFGLSENNNHPDILPDLKSVKAFYFDGSKGVNLKPGTWFWNRCPMNSRASFVAILKHNFIYNDSDTKIVDLREKFGISIKLEL